jgi:hypothetical protein
VPEWQGPIWGVISVLRNRGPGWVPEWQGPIWGVILINREGNYTMDFRKIKSVTFIIALSFTFPLLAYSENSGSMAVKSPFRIAAAKKKKPAAAKKVQKSSALSGAWVSADGMSSLVFVSANQLQSDGETLIYTLVPGAIRITDEDGEKIDYKYTLKGNTLIVNYPGAGDIQFQRIVTPPENQYTQNPAPKKGKSKNNLSSCQSIKVLPSELSGGCYITLVTPAPCEQIDLSNGRSYEFAWQTGGTMCETPFKFYIAGNPYNDQNVLSWQFSTKVGQISRTGGGFTYVTAQDLSNLTSTDGVYSWVVMSWYGSHPASQNFRVRM